MPYDIDEQRHRLCAWVAATASKVPGCRFSVSRGKSLLEDAGMQALISSPCSLPDPRDMDQVHARWRESVISHAHRTGLTFTHGVAAKLINVYFKAAFVCGGWSSDLRVAALRPPIDALLLKGLAANENSGNRRYWRRAQRVRWSNFSSEQYQKAIETIRQEMHGDPLWKVEKFWPGHQGAAPTAGPLR
jgi:hypothetical protein